MSVSQSGNTQNPLVTPVNTGIIDKIYQKKQNDRKIVLTI